MIIIKNKAALRFVTFTLLTWGTCNVPSMARVQDCASILPARSGNDGKTRPITAQDLIELRDIGSRDRPAQENLLSVSPDGRKIAFVISRADQESNHYCRALVTLEIKPGAQARIIDRGGEVIFEQVNIRGLNTDYGFPALVRPAWSPDGQWVAYLKRVNGSTQVWQARADGGGARPTTHSDIDVDSFAWSKDGARILYAARPALKAASQTIDAEGRSGFLYDDRFVPYASNRPAIRLPEPTEYFSVDIASGSVRAADVRERESLAPPIVYDSTEYGLNATVSQDGRKAWTKRRDPSKLLGEIDLWAIDAKGNAVRCSDAICSGTFLTAISSFWWTPNSKEVLFLHREGWGRNETALYRWIPGERPKRSFVTPDLLASCQLIASELLCARESATKPRHLVLINIATGRSRLLYSPNPEFASIEVGHVQRLQWKNEFGFESYGDLVLPPHYRFGQRLPLIVVQYDTRGFLRGGTGDEYPIQLFAARGFAVLSIQNPPTFYSLLDSSNWRTWQDAERENTKGWRDRQNRLSNILKGVQLVTDMGIADPAKIGITGLSDGAVTVHFALINSRIFKAAALSSMGADPQALIYGGAAFADRRRQEGFPSPGSDDPEFWRPVSLAMNAANVGTPLLMQLADSEYLLGVEAFTALKQLEKPVEMYVFPNEFHLKWQPAHRLAIYERNLDWFDFWLRQKEDPNPAKAEQYRRWAAMRRTPETTSSSTAPTKEPVETIDRPKSGSMPQRLPAS